jgi:hypothetical protein
MSKKVSIPNNEFVTYDSYLSFSKTNYLSPHNIQTHFYFICNRGLIRDAQKLFDAKMINQLMLDCGLSYAIKGRKMYMIEYLFEKGAKIFSTVYNPGYYRSSFTEATYSKDINLIILILKNMTKEDYVAGRTDFLYSFFYNKKLFSDIIKAGFNINIHNGILVNLYSDSYYNLKFICNLGGNIHLLTPETIDKIKKAHDPATYEYIGGYKNTYTVMKNITLKKRKDTVYSFLVQYGIIKDDETSSATTVQTTDTKTQTMSKNK